MKIRLASTLHDSIVDGPGLRYVIFTQGCIHHCLGCHNPSTHSLNGGYFVDIDDIYRDIMSNPLLDGVTISGGEPFLQIQPLLMLFRLLKQQYIHIMIYSGYTFEEIVYDDEKKKLLSFCDVLVDGKFILALKNRDLIYRGSSNQRIIDIQSSLKENRVIEYQVSKDGQLLNSYNNNDNIMSL